MNLTIQNRTVEIRLEPLERLWGCHISGKIELPLAEIETVTLARPEPDWQALRAPGTYLPGWIKAGTYYTQRGREFWYVGREPQTLCIDLKTGYYKRIVLASPQAQQWSIHLQAALRATAD